jgi:HNH/ENDO VII superfamily nuclease with conserved GHE residues
VIVKSVADLAMGNDTAKQDEEDYERIGGSTLTIGVTVAMMLLGEIAADLAKSVWDSVSGVFKGEKAPEVKVEVDGDPARPAETPGDAPEIIDGEQVVAHEATPDGHEVKITEEGRCLVCSTCEEIEVRYKDQLDARTPEAESLKAELAEAKKLPNGEAKAEAIEAIEQKLEPKKQLGDAGEPKTVEPAEPTDTAGGKSAKDLAREATLEQIEKVKKSRVENQEGLDRLSREISEARRNINRLKEKVKASSGEERAQAVKELRSAQDVLEDSEGSGLLDEQRGYYEERTKLADDEAKLNESLKLERPALRESTKAAIEQAAERAPDGRFLDANTRKPIDGAANYGHKYGFEQRRLALEAQAKGMNQAQFNDWVNSHPEWFQIESEANNLSHAFEKPGID